MFQCSYLILIKLRAIGFVQKFRHLSTTAAGKCKWDLYAGVLVERLPVVTKALNAIESEFQQYLWQVEYEKSLKSNHELKHDYDIKQAELLKDGKIEVDLDETAESQTAQDLVDAYSDELKKFQFASRVAPDDEVNNTASTNRCLDDTLYLLIEQKFGNRNCYVLPQGARCDGETMLQTAERVVREKCGDLMQVKFYGNAPWGFYKYKYPMNMRDESIGAKVFFYRAVLQNGNVDKSINGKFEWLTKPALTAKLNYKITYAKSVEKFII